MELEEQIQENQSRINHILKEVVDEHLIKGEKYYCIEKNKDYYPSWSFFDHPLHPGMLLCNGVSVFNNKIQVLCHPAKKDGSRASIGSEMIDITKLIY